MLRRNNPPSGWLSRLFRRFGRDPEPTVATVGEHLAAQHLKRGGYRVLSRNLRNRFGEIDILAEAPDQRTLLIVEVKTSASRDSPRDAVPPEVHVNHRKQRKLVALACQVARRYELTDRPIRFDVIGVDLTPDGRDAVIRHHPGAFESHV